MLRSSIAKKIIVAITGALLFGYLVAHMSGNLLIFMGRDAINKYGETLHATGPLLWVARVILLAILLIHIAFTIALARDNQAARPQSYMVTRSRRSTFASRYMIVTGFIVLAFIIYHVAHFTLHWTNPGYAGFEQSTAAGHRHDVYRMVVDAFRRPEIVMVYVVALLFAFTHLWHGVSSMFQSLGLANHRWWPIWKKLGPIIAGLIVLGFLAVPIAVISGAIKPTDTSNVPNVPSKETHSK